MKLVQYCTPRIGFRTDLENRSGVNRLSLSYTKQSNTARFTHSERVCLRWNRWRAVTGATLGVARCETARCVCVYHTNTKLNVTGTSNTYRRQNETSPGRSSDKRPYSRWLRFEPASCPSSLHATCNLQNVTKQHQAPFLSFYSFSLSTVKYG